MPRQGRLSVSAPGAPLSFDWNTCTRPCNSPGQRFVAWQDVYEKGKGKRAIPQKSVRDDGCRHESQRRNLTVPEPGGGLATFVRPGAREAAEIGHHRDGTIDHGLFRVSGDVGRHQRVVLHQGPVERRGLFCLPVLALVFNFWGGGGREERDLESTNNIQARQECGFVMSGGLPQEEIPHERGNDEAGARQQSMLRKSTTHHAVHVLHVSR
jgi:hypothetical protein